MPRLEVFPLPAGTYYWSSPYGPRGGGFHAGVDLAAPQGTPIYAPVSGLLNQAWDLSGGGNWTNLWADDGTRFGFGHAVAYYDPDGAGPATSLNGYRVTAGQVIAYVGTTGYSSGPHLHFAYDAPGPPSNYVDPTLLLRDAEHNNRFVGIALPPTHLPEELDMAAEANIIARIDSLEGKVAQWEQDTRAIFAKMDQENDLNALKLAVNEVTEVKKAIDKAVADITALVEGLK